MTEGTCTRSSHLLAPVQADPVAHYWDPIVFPGVTGYFLGGPLPFSAGVHGPAHWHTFFGNTSLNPDGIVEPNAPSTCTSFAGAFWVPALLAYTETNPIDGTLAEARTMSFRFRQPAGAITPPPGLGIIAKQALWDCGPGTPRTDVPHTCSSGTVQATLRFPRFWDGVNLHLPGEAHVSYVASDAFPVRLPGLRVRVDFGLQTNYLGSRILALSVGGIPIAAQQPDGSFVVVCDDDPRRCEDERSFHMDVLY